MFLLIELYIIKFFLFSKNTYIIFKNAILEKK